MSREWKPGDVAMLPNERIAVVDRVGRFLYGGEPYDYVSPGSINARDARPLAVIDPEDREQVGRLYDFYYELRLGEQRVDHLVDTLQAALREFAEPTPSKPHRPDEPGGQGAVVEDAAGCRWLRRVVSGRSPWAHYDETERATRVRDWDEIDAVRVLSDGVQP